MSAKDAASTVLKYLKDQNRPFSVNDIVLNLHKEFGKAGVQKGLDSLVVDGKVVEKINGKQKAYVIFQGDLPTANEAELSNLDVEVARKTEELKGVSEALRAKGSSLKKLESSISTAEAQKKIKNLTLELSEMDERLSKLSKDCVLVTKEEKENVMKEHEKYVKEWRKRKKMVVNVTDAILESYPKSKKALFEEIEIETDDDAGVEIPDI